MLDKRNILFFLCVFCFYLSKAQNCNLSLAGYVFDETSELPLPYVNVYLQETTTGAITKDDGSFEINNICPGEYHLIFSHIGCEAIKMHIDLFRDTTIRINLSHTQTSLQKVVIEGSKEEQAHLPNSSVTRKTIENNVNKNLSGLLEEETGVHLIKNGNGISKPVVHGLYGNRLIILNNGVVQSGQQWGNDHSPEIDPFAADKITVIKGASVLEYAGGNLGSAILVEPKKIEREPHLHGQFNYAFETNGRGHNVNARIQKYTPALAWRVNGTLKKYGDRKSADYFLNNTGLHEANLSLQLEKSWNEKIFFDFYGSTFNTQLGVLRGSHIGNLTDLETALSADVPFFTEPDFSYTVESPKQKVAHHLAKAKIKYYFEDDKHIEWTLAGQLNNRKEFDVRRGGRSSIPALFLNQFVFVSDVKYSMKLDEYWSLKIGDQYTFTDNKNKPETGILPLIPDYLSMKNGLYVTLAKKLDDFGFNAGLRYDYEYQNVPTISSSIPRTIIRYKNNFHNLSALLAFNVDLTKNQTISWNMGFNMRNPAINELYSFGLHQGVSGIEEGDVDLKVEKAIKNTLEYKWLPSNHFSLNALVYHQYFKDYIFLNPQEEKRLTIRGAFPVYRYEQTDAMIYGLDVSTQFTLGSSVHGLLKYSFLRGRDVKEDIPLVFMPPNSYFGSITYRLANPANRARKIKIEDTEIELNHRYVFEQKNLLPEQDFAPPPSGYGLFGLQLSTHFLFADYRMRCFAKVDNLFNVSYRDYLNRQRYFADDLGWSITFGAHLKF